MEFLMKKVSTKTDSAELGLLKNMLDEAGIRCALGTTSSPYPCQQSHFMLSLGSER